MSTCGILIRSPQIGTLATPRTRSKRARIFNTRSWTNRSSTHSSSHPIFGARGRHGGITTVDGPVRNGNGNTVARRSCTNCRCEQPSVPKRTGAQSMTSQGSTWRHHVELRRWRVCSSGAPSPSLPRRKAQARGLNLHAGWREFRKHVHRRVAQLQHAEDISAAASPGSDESDFGLDPTIQRIGRPLLTEFSESLLSLTDPVQEWLPSLRQPIPGTRDLTQFLFNERASSSRSDSR
jgi:hypothetical protein